MFKIDSFENELYDSMNGLLKKQAKNQHTIEERKNLKTVLAFNAIALLLEENNLIHQAKIVTKFLGKEASFNDLVNAFDDKFKLEMNEEVQNHLQFLFSQAGVPNETIHKMIKKESFSSLENLFNSKFSRAVKPVLNHENEISFFNKKEKESGNKILNNIKNIKANNSLNTKVEELSPKTEIRVFDDFEDD
ncbi:MAG: hypothetical protein LC122_12960 [Chitinophagales bacterium]|nr:hypothetical protein [Chitinophagales bacterium]